MSEAEQDKIRRLETRISELHSKNAALRFQGRMDVKAVVLRFISECERRISGAPITFQQQAILAEVLEQVNTSPENLN